MSLESEVLPAPLLHEPAAGHLSLAKPKAGGTPPSRELRSWLKGPHCS